MPETKYSRNRLQEMLPDQSGPVLIDLGCGARKRPGHIGVDIAKLPGVDLEVDIDKGLPFEDNSIDGLYSNFLFEHVRDIVFLFKEIYRVCRNSAVVEFRVPHYQSLTQYKDPTHKSVILPETIPYFTADKWYGSDYGINTEFRLIETQYEYLPPFSRWVGRRYFLLRPLLFPVLMFARRFLWNVVHSITIRLKVIKR